MTPTPGRLPRRLETVYLETQRIRDHRAPRHKGEYQNNENGFNADVLNTYRVWLVYELFRGAITAKELDWSEAQICAFVASRKSVNPHLYAAVAKDELPLS
jgi:hypothetical protein